MPIYRPVVLLLLTTALTLTVSADVLHPSKPPATCTKKGFVPVCFSSKDYNDPKKKLVKAKFQPTDENCYHYQGENLERTRCCGQKVSQLKPDHEGFIFIPREVIVHGSIDKPEQGDKLDCV
ncbi:uncharacterized protein PGTG_05401 [Puccinia graminis f. sp. tritici CRL 75-36-700-3]|uniref:Uncharacterized protein n=1 Tax=Puccinia graminis f. sp. tritici (strain CRL 75-36-700-3 / race SCCL) TaxID=418459 RepID=E3K6Q6_PUCGT|nr:uncharacterized protein PGTG_05401 [Puccinia graminis f. sp. tritici CRL 75-36-700-3]EFP80176.1 hypothetical protein PGTG_05401 [Puccinia graminis f. sp. tritici CRL 75-36-700-3]